MTEPVDAPIDRLLEGNPLMGRHHMGGGDERPTQPSQAAEIVESNRIGAVQMDHVRAEPASQGGHCEAVVDRLRLAQQAESGSGQIVAMAGARDRWNDVEAGRQIVAALELVAGGGHQGHPMAALGQRPGQVVGVMGQSAVAEGLDLEDPQRGSERAAHRVVRRS